MMVEKRKRTKVRNKNVAFYATQSSSLVLIVVIMIMIQLCIASSPIRVVPQRLAHIDPIQHLLSSKLSNHKKRYDPGPKQYSLRFDTVNNSRYNNNNNNNVNTRILLSDQLRAGGSTGQDPLNNINNVLTGFEQVIKTFIEIVTTIAMIVLPPTTFIISSIFRFYQQLPHDAIMAQAGLVYCFAGGYFPTLFAAVSAAQNSGMSIIIQAISDLVEEGTKAVEAVISDEIPINSQYAPYWGTERSNWKPFYELTTREKFGRKTRTVLATVDPVKINTAIGALYSTWLGISAVLEKQFARTITLAVTIAEYLQPTTSWIIGPPLRLLIPNDLHRWIPLFIGWGCKAAAMSVAWKLQRILSATTSSIAGGFMFSRHFLRLLFRTTRQKFGKTNRGKTTKFRSIDDDDEDQGPIFDDTTSVLDEIIGLAIAGLGLYTQIGNGFSFEIPFPLNLITWPFSFAENWIQWQITKKNE